MAAMQPDETPERIPWVPLAIFGAAFLFVLSRAIMLQVEIWSFTP